MLAKTNSDIKKGSVVIIKNGICFAITTPEEFNQSYDSIFNVDKNYQSGQEVEYFIPEFLDVVEMECNNIRKLLQIQPKIKCQYKRKILSLISLKTKSISKERNV